MRIEASGFTGGRLVVDVQPGEQVPAIVSAKRGKEEMSLDIVMTLQELAEEDEDEMRCGLMAVIDHLESPVLLDLARRIETVLAAREQEAMATQASS
jgi:hypothetical protein